MAEFANLSEVLNRLSGGNSGTPEMVFINKTLERRSNGTQFVSAAAGKTFSAWMSDGGSPGAGAAPGAVAVPTSATLGAIPLTNASGGRDKRLIAATFAYSTVTNYGLEYMTDVFLYDRLLHQSNLSGTTTGAQNVQTGSGVTLTRHTGGAGNEIWIEIYGTAIGATPQTVTCSYTNQAGTSGRTTLAMPIGAASASTALKSIQEVARLSLQAGDTGVQSVETLTLSGSTGTAGVMGVTIANRVARIPCHDGIGMVDFTYGDSGTPIIEASACLAMMWRPASSSIVPIQGVLATAER